MRITSSRFGNGKPIPAAFAMGTPDGFGGNRNPPLAWSEVPDGTRSFALLCIDPDAPSDASLANADGIEIAVAHPRGDFVHWVMVDIAADLREIAEGRCSDGVTKAGKTAPAGPAGARQGSNSYTQWFDADAEMGGQYFGYDGPYPPANDLRLHRYFFRLFALDVATLALPDGFTAGDVQRAMHGHVLGEALTWGSYTLNPKVRG
ncbi:MAG: YbhB/YbcL family Raf kinase inhibitor-like protein [Luteimonas sp.]